MIYQIIVIAIYYQAFIERHLFWSLPLAAVPAGFAAVLNGASLGGEIVCEAAIRGKISPTKRGMKVMFLSLLFYCLLISSLAGYASWSAIYALNIFMEQMLVGLMGFGWLIALLGAGGGWLLDRASGGSSR
ncbi:MAG TPA: hypothetical protein VJ302_27595 [Blastocatellia bacterium]|nr:hypothetical protein [Blastocatellia bacterium]